MTSRPIDRIFAGLCLLLASAAIAAATTEVPFLSGRVNDHAELIDPETEERIDGLLAAFEERTGAQIAVLTIVSLGGEPVEMYSLRVAETWGLGREEADDGVLFLVARDDRRMRIEVGYGLEADLTDAESGRILRNVVTPRFQGGDFSGGIEAGVGAITGTLEGSIEPPVEVERVGGRSRDREPRQSAVGVLVASVFSWTAIFASGVVSWLVFLLLAPVWVALARAILGAGYGFVGLGAWVAIFLLAKLLLATPVGRRWLETRRRRRSRRSSWGRGRGGGWSSGGWSGGGFSGGGFSGGGGSFGGGGASGSW